MTKTSEHAEELLFLLGVLRSLLLLLLLLLLFLLFVGGFLLLLQLAALLGGFLVLVGVFVELDAGLGDLDLAHLVGIGKQERAVEVAPLAVLQDVARTLGPVALHVGRQVAHVDALIAAVFHDGVDGADRQFAAFLLAHLGRALLGDVDLEVGIGIDGADVVHVHHLAQVEGLGADLTADVFVEAVDGEREVQRPCCRAERALELLMLPQDGEHALVADVAEVLQLFHHQFLDGELVDDFYRDVVAGLHLPDLEAAVELLAVLQVLDVADGGDLQFLVLGADLDVAEGDGAVGTAHGQAEVEG